MILHPWHEVLPGDYETGQLNAVIEIPKGSRAKFEIDKASGLIKLDRVLYASMYFPLNYGFIPQTLGEDGDPLDIVVLTQANVVPLCMISCRVIGVMRMIDRGEPDDKIIAVANNDISVSEYSEVNHLPNHIMQELKHFFEQYKALEQKLVVVDEILPRATAFEIIEKSLQRYREKFRKE